MKKRNILQNSMIAIICIILCKVIGLIYVIPFKAMISRSAGALYSYAYNIYVIFLAKIKQKLLIQKKRMSSSKKNQVKT